MCLGIYDTGQSAMTPRLCKISSRGATPDILWSHAGRISDVGRLYQEEYQKGHVQPDNGASE